MIKDYFINEIENAVEKAVNAAELGSMTEYKRGTLVPERPKNVDFGDYAVNVSSLARFAKIAPPQIANNVLKYINTDDNEYTVIGGFINFKAGKKLLSNGGIHMFPPFSFIYSFFFFVKIHPKTPLPFSTVTFLLKYRFSKNNDKFLL